MAASDETAIRERLTRIRTQIAAAAERAGRPSDSVQLLAVSKGQPLEAIRLAARAGQLSFGESYAQEFADKAEALTDLVDIRWHFIGTLQRNKAKIIAEHAHQLQTVDRSSLVTALDHRLETADRKMDVFIEVNVSGEEQKGGVSPDGVEVILEAVHQSSRLRAVGLMTVPSRVDDPEDSRKEFRMLRTMLERLQPSCPTLTQLSMGMSADFEVAVEEGATIVRIGTMLFGPRNYQ